MRTQLQSADLELTSPEAQLPKVAQLVSENKNRKTCLHQRDARDPNPLLLPRHSFQNTGLHRGWPLTHPRTRTRTHTHTQGLCQLLRDILSGVSLSTRIWDDCHFC